ncbi:MAG TPA: TIGR03118 family protein [Ktedonobacteraceae bacterium]
MHVRFIPGRLRLLASVIVLPMLLLLALPVAAFAQSTVYQQTNLVSDLASVHAQFTDPNLVNPWGLVHGPTSPWWVSDNGTGMSTVYNGNGTPVNPLPPGTPPLVVSIPAPGGGPGGTPTGIVFNSVFSTNPDDFVVSANGKSGPSIFMFATEDGTISGWNPTVDRNNAVLAVDRSNVGKGAVYKGLATGSNSSGTFIFATNFRFGRVEMFDSNFNLVRSFTDHRLPQSFAPFGIQNIGDKLYVTFAKKNAAKHDDVAGPGHGFVDVFDTSGNLISRLIARGSLNSPWGLALAPANFGQFSNDLLVGNFGDGHINAFDPNTGAALGSLENSGGVPIQIDGLWALQFGGGPNAGASNELFFTAGIDGEAHGLFGKIQSES